MATGKGDIHRMRASGAKLFAMINMGVLGGPRFAARRRTHAGDSQSADLQSVWNSKAAVPQRQPARVLHAAGRSVTGGAPDRRFHELCRRDLRDADLHSRGGAARRPSRATRATLVPRTRASLRQARAQEVRGSGRAEKGDTEIARARRGAQRRDARCDPAHIRRRWNLHEPDGAAEFSRSPADLVLSPGVQAQISQARRPATCARSAGQARPPARRFSRRRASGRGSRRRNFRRVGNARIAAQRHAQFSICMAAASCFARR